MKKKNKDFTDELAEMMPPERAARAKKAAEKEIFQIRLAVAELRKKGARRISRISNFITKSGELLSIS